MYEEEQNPKFRRQASPHLLLSVFHKYSIQMDKRRLLSVSFFQEQKG